MDREVRYNRKDNIAKNFGIIVSRLMQIASEYDMSTSEVIKAFIQDIENQDKEDYEIQIKKMAVKGMEKLPKGMKASFIRYLNKVYTRDLFGRN